MPTIEDSEIKRWMGLYWMYMVVDRNGEIGDPDDPDIEKDESLIRKMRRMMQIIEKYNGLVAQKYNVVLNAVDCWKYARENGLNILYATEDEIVKYMKLYASDLNDKFAEINNNNEDETKEDDQEQKQDNQQQNDEVKNKSEYEYEVIVPELEKRALIYDAMLHFHIIDHLGRSRLTNKQKGKLAGFIDALLENNIIPDYSKRVLDQAFCKKFNIEYKRLKRESKQYELMLSKANSYFKKKLPIQ